VSGPERDFYELLGVPRGAVLARARVLGEVELDALEAAWGTSRSVRVGREEPCAACAGSGYAPGHEVGVCRTCAGRGTIRVSPALRRGRWLKVDPCGACGGDGRVRLPCPECDGDGTTRRERTITVRIAPGVEDGARLRVVGEPENSHLLIRVLPRAPESRLIRYAAAALFALALAFLVFLLQMG
jgi:DnaJ-class molecular chaperone